jgi:K+-sensing histidine kinase KdpD
VPGERDTVDVERRLAEVEALRRRVLNVIPHALRTPITTFRGLSEALAHATEEQIRDEIGPALRRLSAQAEHLLDDLLIASGYTTALPTADPQATPIVETARSVWRDLGIDRPLEIEGDETAAVVAPAGSVFKILVHVLDNAGKYGEGPARLQVTKDEGRVLVEVASGGADPGDVAMFTEPFYRGEAAVMRASGLGVGLTVARALAVQAGGTLDVKAATGGGLLTCLDLVAAP